MMIISLYILIGAFLVTSAIFSFICATGVKSNRYESIGAQVKLHFFGLSTRKGIRQNLRPDRRKAATRLLLAREIIFVSIIVVAFLEYVLR